MCVRERERLLSIHIINTRVREIKRENLRKRKRKRPAFLYIIDNRERETERNKK